MGKDSAKQRGQGMGVLRTLGVALGYWRPHWRIAVVLLMMLALQQGFKAFFAYSLGLVVKLVGAGNRQGLILLLVALAVGFVVAGVAAVVADYLSARVGAAIINSVRRRMFHHLQRLSMGFFSQARSGDVVARFTSDLADIQKGLTNRIIDAFVASLGLLISIPLAFYTEWRLALAMLLVLPLIGIGTRLFGHQAAASRYALKQEEAGVAATVQENVHAQPVIKVFGLKDFFLGRFESQLAGLGKRWVKAELTAQLVGSASTLGVQAVQVLVIAFGAWLALTGRLAPGYLVAFITLQANISKDAYDLLKKVVPNLISSSGGLRRIEELLAEPVEVSSPPGAPRLTRLQGPIRFERVGFGYTPDRPVLDDVSFSIAPGQRVTVVGPSGSGKSTILQLLLRFYDPQAGRVTADGHDLRGLDLPSYHAQIAAVFQESLLFSGTIGENIRLGRVDASDAEVQAAARAAEIHDLVMGLPDRYQTAIGELGGKLSGGQRQRLSIARAMLRNPALLILDEATSALDPATETAINATLDRLSRGRIVVSVTHRLAAARTADRILVMDQGRLAESGTHDELLARRGVYFGLWTKQAGIAVEADGSRASLEPDWLAHVPLFATLSAPERVTLAGRMTSLTVAPGQVVVRQGEEGDRFFIVARGKVEVIREIGQETQRLAVLSDGDFFGELAFIDDAPRMASVRTLQPTVFLTLAGRDFEDLLRAHPRLRQAVESEARRRGTAGAPAAGFMPRPPAPAARPAVPGRVAAVPPAPEAAATVFLAPTHPTALVVVRGPGAGTRFPLRAQTRIGRSADNEVVLPDATVSSHHAAVVLRGTVAMLTDLDSTNGTTHNGVEVTQPVNLAIDDLIVVGDIWLKVV